MEDHNGQISLDRMNPNTCFVINLPIEINPGLEPQIANLVSAAKTTIFSLEKMNLRDDRKH